MDDSFAYRTTVPIRRQVDPRLLKAGVVAIVATIAVVLFAAWVIGSERRSFERAETRVAPVPSVAPSTDRVVEPEATQADVDEALRLAVDAARAARATAGSFRAATPARLAELQPGYTFVDGPSTTPSVVSVASTASAWAAAVLGPNGACTWATLDRDGSVLASVGAECTGAAALDSLGVR